MLHQGIPKPRAEAPLLLDTAPPRTLGFRDQAAFWTNLGVSLIGFQSAATVLVVNGSNLSIPAALTAVVAGTAIGSVMLGIAAVIGTRAGAPAMAILRGLFGTRLSYLPTVLNIVQCLGWGVFELTVIALGADALFGGGPHWLYVLAAGLLTTVMTIRPLGAIAVLRKYVAVAVGVAMLFFTVELLRRGVPTPVHGSWKGFLPATDSVIAIAISFVPLAADYTRHAKSTRSSFWGAFTGYTLAQVWCYAVGLMALLQVGGDTDRIFSTFMGITAGWLFFAVLVLREADQSFANVYSTAMSVQNLLPRVDRRVLTLGLGALVTGLALLVTDFSGYEAFLGLIGAVFVPLSAVLAVDFFFGAGRREQGWDLSEDAATRWLPLLPWAVGFAVYELIYPAALTGWASGWPTFWAHAQNVLHVHPQVWTSASLFSFAVPVLLTWLLTPLLRRGR